MDLFHRPLCKGQQGRRRLERVWSHLRVYLPQAMCEQSYRRDSQNWILSHFTLFDLVCMV